MDIKKADWTKWNSKEDHFIETSNISSNLIYGTFSNNVPEVSVMLITYKRADGLKKALESALHQTYSKPYEIVVVDDSGYDEKTDELMKQYCQKYSNIIYYRHEKNLGQYDNWNRACMLCRTEWYCLLHDDDQMSPHYLDELMKCKDKYPNAGLIGSYMETIDERNLNAKKSLVDRLVSIFISLRHGKGIPLTLKDNMHHIFVLSCCLFINRQKALELGGLDDRFFPSSDFVFASKMNYYYQTVFLPLVLSYRGIGENESLKQSVCENSIICGYRLTEAIANTLNYSKDKVEQLASNAAVCAEIGVRGYNSIDYGEIKKQLGMDDSYNLPSKMNRINLLSKLRWGMLLFRSGKSRR